MSSKKITFFIVFCAIAGGLFYLKSISYNEGSPLNGSLEESKKANDDHDHNLKPGKARDLGKSNAALPKLKLDPKLAAHSAHQDDPHKMGRTVKLPTLKDRPAFNPVNERERSLESITNEVIQMVQQKRSHTDFIAFLKKNELEPRVADSRNDDTGGMIMVRSDKALPGTRYYHAQFFNGDKGEQPFLQHISFEYPPGADSFQRAQKAAEVLFDASEKTYSKGEDFAEYKGKDCMTLWINKMDAEDFKNDPYNAYSSQDIGSVKVAIEQDIHCH